MSMNYKILKRLIARSAERTGKRNVDFKIDINSLNNELAELELTCLPYGLTARRISVNDIPMLGEYYREDKMNWLSDEKYITSLIFVDTNKIDDNLTNLIEQLQVKYEDDPDIDHVAILAEILGSYPCYLSVVVSYQNNSPNSVGKNSYYIACRANKVIIKDPEYVYTPTHPIPDPQIHDHSDLPENDDDDEIEESSDIED